MKQYTIFYTEFESQYPKQELVLAHTTRGAYSKFMESKNWSVYSAWVDHYTTKTGRVHYFRNFEGKPY